ncbi:MAG TPA: M56 family metallopeptidase, partial [Gammaproteobacteria bacterium]|nr:M56 family metallopeptidase [Gammaproteobacteria bacterium]
MLVWMAYAVEVALLLSAAAFCAERAARARRGSSRWIWLTSIVASLALPLLVSFVASDVLSLDLSAAVSRVIPLRSITSPALSPAIWMSGHTGELGAWRAFDPLVTRAWLAASFLLSVGLTASAVHLSWRKRTWQTATVSGSAVYVARDTGPAVVGIVQPRIVIPAWILRASAAQQAMVMAHERSHIEAGDQRLLAVALCVLVFMPWNIPLWWQLRRLRNAIEIDCDARVLTCGHSVADYGEVLLVVNQRQSVFIGAVAAMSERASFLEQRIRIMMSVPTPWRRISTVILGALSLGITAVAAGVVPPNAVSAVAVNREA